MSSNARVCRLENLLEVTSSKRIHMADYVESGVPFYRSKEVIERSKGNKISTELFISREQFETIKNKFGSPKDGDILLTSVGTLGVPYLIKGDGDFYFKDGNLTWMRNFTNEISPRFLYYWLTSPSVQQKLDEISIGSTQKALTISALKSLEIPLPTKVVQDEIVEILDSISDRIALLRETNITLEAIAQALFKSWFVDFDPVHAKQQGREPEGMDANTAALFPDSFEESELGLVPMGWNQSTLGQTFILTMGQSPPGDTYNGIGNGLPFFQGRTDFGFRFPAQRIYCTAPTRLAMSGDILVSVRAPVGDVNVALEKCAIGRGVAGVRHPDGYQSFALNVIRSLHPYFQNFNGEGTIFGSITKKDFQNLPVTCPPKSLVEIFDNLTKSLDARIEINEKQLRGFTNLRDTLLPRLISGQLRLPESL